MQVTLRAVAAEAIEAAVNYYRPEAGPETALPFVDSFETAIDHLSRHPFTGSLRFAFELEIPELRSWRLERFPYLVFYVAGDDLIDIWRVLHVRRDVPAHLTDEPPV
ncbi:MAG: type II toxin-antitoxin system RelE/ParE family toxin [Acidimicrobiia bacterium]|nr:type II toxin-antitoxin system RelE/ParE family toxin [Acidimicrobiia bacterium]